jgi:hypothetical protein
LPHYHGDSRVLDEQTQESVCRFWKKKLMEVEAFEILKPVPMKIAVVRLDDGAFPLFKINSLLGSRDFSLVNPLLIEVGGVQGRGTYAAQFAFFDCA